MSPRKAKRAWGMRCDEGAEDGESAEAGVEDADGGGHSFQIAGLAVGEENLPVDSRTASTNP